MRNLKSLLLVIYALSAVGVNIRIHYCCGQLADVHWGTYEKGSDNCQSETCCKSHKDCCRFEDIIISNCGEHNVPQLQSAPLNYVLEEQHKNFISAAPLSKLSELQLASSHQPPPLLKEKIYLVLCQRKCFDEMV